MIFENFFVDYDNSLCINNLSSYKNIRTKFITKFIDMYSFNYSNQKELYSDALIYSKYYLYYKIQNCVYSNEIMEIIYNIENL